MSFREGGQDPGPGRNLPSQLTVLENQDQQLYETEVRDAASLAAHNYRQRRRQDILAELVELRLPNRITNSSLSLPAGFLGNTAVALE